MKIHEYQGKALLKEYGVPVPRGIVARTPEEAEAAAIELGTEVVVVKAQIHAGGRGKGGGVKLAKSPAEAKEVASQILGMQLITHQTGPVGQKVQTLLIEEGLPIDREFYLGITLDRVTGRNVFMASSAGGMDIEKVAEETPELILKETIDPSVGLRGFQARKLAFGLGIPNDLINTAAKFMLSLYDAYEKMDASLVEINPFLLTKDNRLIALDAKVTFDDNAMFRHKEYADLRDLAEEEPLEIEASKYDLNYIKL
ncbi:MAG TPA: ATP-grasp domain-containing protein, partial [Pyrinomonadaceae bacterium]|nr:ATP-grasp domain-containing protein [Pyrinomonadaceae bacterium]